MVATYPEDSLVVLRDLRQLYRVAKNCPSLIKVVPIDSKESDNRSPSLLIKFFFLGEKDIAKNLNSNVIANGGF